MSPGNGVRAAAVAGCLVLLGSLVACSQTSSTQGGPTTHGVSATQTASSPPSAPTTRTVKARWMLVRSSPRSSSIVVIYSFNSCGDDARADVTSTHRSVRLAIVGTERTDVQCSLDGLITTARVRLGHPLDHRTVIGACNVHTQPGCKDALWPVYTLPVSKKMRTLHS